MAVPAGPLHVPNLTSDLEDESGSLSVRVDRATGIIRVYNRGFYSLDLITRHFEAVERIGRAVLQTWGRLKILTDLRGMPVQSAKVTEIISSGTSRTFRAGDLVARIVDSKLLGMQMTRLNDQAFCRNFDDPQAAEIWLLSEIDTAL